jgi:protease I
VSKGLVVIPIADGVEDLEYHVPRMRLQEIGYQVLGIGLDLSPVTGKNGLIIPVDRLISDISANDVAGMILAGGWAPDKLRRYPELIKLIKAVDAQKKPIGIICHGGLLAISAGIVYGKPSTGSLGIKDDLINAGTTWVDEAAFTDGNLIWGRIVADIPAFNAELVKAFK